MTTLPTQCQKKVNGCFCDNVYVKNTVYTDLIQPRTSGGKVSIPALDLAGLECLNLTTSTTNVGCGAGGSLGTNMTSVGTNALRDATGNANVAVGNAAGISITIGSGNTLVGSNVSGALTTGISNVIIGQLAGNTIETGSSNTIIGQGAGSAVDAGLIGCVLLGRAVGQTNITNNRLMIDNSSTNEPLIDGDFTGNTLQINGQVTLGTDSTTPVHKLNTDTANTSTEANVEYIRIEINGLGVRRIPTFDDA